MKALAIFSTLLLGIHFATAHSPEEEKGTAAENLGRQILSSFQNKSIKEYYHLFPSLEELHGLMMANSEAYSVFLDVAKKDFAKVYQKRIKPEIESAYLRTFYAGCELGIEWSEVIFVGAYETEAPRADGTNSLVIEFLYGQKNYKLLVEKVMMLSGEWKTTQYITLI
ncbi:MAG: hypothetical protein RIG68_08175 [Imperialibacter sp.]|mgnify:FL=1|uniref:hypothetical protein n=1 Tax=Imperialibacter sp. TaxID=2038411 RepID=UPI0032EAEAE3